MEQTGRSEQSDSAGLLVWGPAASRLLEPAESMMTTDLTICGIALRTAPRGPMKLVEQAVAEADGGLVGDVPRKSVERGITFLSRRQWEEVTNELSARIPWHTRRANMLVDGCGSLAPLIGQQIRIGGEVVVEILAETRPCGLMESSHAGLERALDPDCRGGVYGRVLQPGSINVGDAVTIL